MHENKMGTMPIDKLLLSMSIPMIISMLIQSLYNIVDSVFVSMISEDALTAVSLCFPIQIFMISVSVGTNIGVNALLSKSLGEKDFKKSTKVANMSIFLSLFLGFIFMLIGIFFTKSFFDMQQVTPQIRTYGMQYMSIICIFNYSLLLQICFEKLLNSTGRTHHTMLTQMSGAITNIILDPIFIFVLKLGVAGAAIATVIGLFVGTLVGFYLSHYKNDEFELSLKSVFTPDIIIIKEIFHVGFPSILMKSISSFTILGFNIILAKFSTTAVAFFGIFFKLDSFMILPIIGLSNGLIPIVAYNYGAKDKKRIYESIKVTLKYGAYMTFVGMLLINIFPRQILMMFSATKSMLDIGVPALRIISICYLFAFMTIILTSAFQALGNGYFSMTASFVRQVILLLPLAYIFALYNNLTLVWTAFGISDLLAFLLTLVFTKIMFNRIEKDLNQNTTS